MPRRCVGRAGGRQRIQRRHLTSRPCALRSRVCFRSLKVLRSLFVFCACALLVSRSRRRLPGVRWRALTAGFSAAHADNSASTTQAPPPFYGRCTTPHTGRALPHTLHSESGLAAPLSNLSAAHHNGSCEARRCAVPHLRRPPARPRAPLPAARAPAHARYPLASFPFPAPTLAPRGCDDRCALRYKVLTAPLSALPHRAARLTAPPCLCSWNPR